MKKIITIMLTGAGLAAMLGACKDQPKPKDTAEYVDNYVIPTPGDPIALQQSPVRVEARWQGTPCQVSIMCQPLDSTDMVYNEFGQAYKGNAFELTIQKTDGTRLYGRRVTKQVFVDKIKDEHDRAVYAEQAVLRNVSAEVDDDGIFRCFVVSLQLPEAVDDDNILFHLFTDGTCRQEEIDYMHNNEEPV